jgi:hypothetical protein
LHTLAKFSEDRLSAASQQPAQRSTRCFVIAPKLIQTTRIICIIK